jgi:CO/xanthine dehydrogenase FAD-binding subunit
MSPREQEAAMGLYLRPTALDDALAALAAQPLTVLAGGTDIYPARVGRALDDDVLDIAAVAGLRGVAQTAEGWRIGAATTWSDVIEAPLPPVFDGLKLAAREVGGRQIQNAGTLAGNLCNASPAADGVPPLLALDAEVELASHRGVRRLPLAQFVLGNRRTARRADELLAAIHVPAPRADARSGFVKLGARKYLVISIVMVAGVLEVRAGRIVRARLALGACSEVALRLPLLERALEGRPVDEDLAALVEPAQFATLSPIDDVRADVAYRREAAPIATSRLLAQLGAASWT